MISVINRIIKKDALYLKKQVNGLALNVGNGGKGKRMNERMMDLARQAGLKKEHGSDREYIGNFDWRMFGELMIQDCVTQVALLGISNFENEDIMWAVETSIENIKERFGITK